jgi:hypothetical protein
MLRPIRPRHSLLLTLALALPLLAISAPGCATRGSGTSATETREVEAFERIDLSGAFTVVIHVDPSAPRKLTLTADDNLLELIRTRVDGAELEIGMAPSTKIVTKTQIRVEIWTPSLTGIEASGATKLEVAGLHGERFVLDASGASDATLGGAVDRLEVDMSGAGKLDARALAAKQVEIDLSGAGGAMVSASETLDVDISGAGKVTYYGSPTISQDISGAGKLEAGA